MFETRKVKRRKGFYMIVTPCNAPHDCRTGTTVAIWKERWLFGDKEVESVFLDPRNGSVEEVIEDMYDKMQSFIEFKI